MTTQTLTHQVQVTAARAASLMLALVLLAVPCVGAAPAMAAGASSPAFPRLAIWWPDTHTQSVASLSRCGVLVLQNHDSNLIPGLRAANPGIFVLGNTSACELSYSLGGYNDPANVELRSVSTDWMLTQVGSTLTAGITASTTSIPVADVTKFTVGEMALVDHELVHIDAINGSVLTVTARGCVNPAASHTTGTRIASLVRHWPGTVVMDLSTSCPKVDMGHGLETWAGWNERRGLGVLESADWDGLFVDALQSNPSWMVDQGDVRSIDPRRANEPVADGYATFNAEWNAGAMAFGGSLRAGAGGRVLLGNGNLWNPEFNGNIFEEFPYANIDPAVWNIVFVGPFSAPHASYPEWCANATRPIATIIQVYGAATDYRLMRFGLCSALTNDGFFSYARSSTTHAYGGLDWFDEYDNAGAGLGYLGQPTGAATQAGNAWRRDYDNGIALVNPTTSPVTVQLGGTFHKIKGIQDRTVNDGTSTTSVMIPAHDGIILLRGAAPGITTPPVNGTPSTPSPISTQSTNRSFMVSGYVIKHVAGTSPITLQFYRYQSGHWVLRKPTTAKASDVLTFSQYSDSTSVPYSGKWRVRARHKVGTKYLYSGYRTFTVITTPSSKGAPSTPSTPSRVAHGASFTVSGYVMRHTAGTSPIKLYFYRYQSGHWVLRKTTYATVSNFLTFSKYSDSTSVPYPGKWRVKARHIDGSHSHYSGYRYFTAS